MHESHQTIDALLASLKSHPKSKRSVTDLRTLEAREASYGVYPERVSDWIREALARRGVRQPYSHQADAWAAIYDDAHTVVVTPTASGKTLCYNVPVLDMLGELEEGNALYLFPTKALAQDQAAELNALLDAADVEEVAHVYDGDTPQDIRRRVRRVSRVILSNPDMLHAAILPNHDKWRRFFTHLKYVVVDEMHTYRGVFGSHVANVFRRLQRVCRYYGAYPTFVFASATIANPQELAEALISQPVRLVNRSGAPQGARRVVLYNPPIVDLELKRRQSADSAAFRLARRVIEAGHHVIVFARSRQGVEAMTRRLKEAFVASRRSDLALRIEGYRGGYLPNDRRRIEKGLREGQVQAVISTNALELGIDIGSLDVCIISGYPGTIASTWQQAGRAGRRSGTSLTILVGRDDPVDQYLVNHPDYLFDASPEHGRIDADNLRILVEHLKCAAFELPFGAEEGFGTFEVEDTQEVLRFLSEEAQVVTRSGDVWRWSTDGYPATTVSLRDIPDENFIIIDTTATKPQVIGQIDFFAAHKTVFQNAIYQHAAKLYEVHQLDYKERKAYIRHVEPEYFTQAIDQTRVFVLDLFEERGEQGAAAGWGEVRIVTRFPGYKKLRFKTLENIGFGVINLPDLEKHTTSYWIAFEPELLDQVDADEEAIAGALVGVGNVLQTVAVVHLMCTKGDLRMTVGSREGAAWEQAQPDGLGGEAAPIAKSGVYDRPAIFLYDKYPGGVGFSEKLFAMHDTLLGHALGLVEDCGCEAGCPACVGPPGSVTPQGKAVATQILRTVVSGPLP